MALSINGEEVYPSSLTPVDDPHVLTITVDGIPYRIRRSAYDAKFDLKMRDPEGNPREMTPELKAKIFEGIADAKNNRAVLDAQGNLEYGNQNTAELLPYEPVDNNNIPVVIGRGIGKYSDEFKWRLGNDPGSIALQGKYTMPAIAASALLPLLGKAAATTSIASIPTTTWINTAATAGFAGHGLNHWLNEGINGWGDAAMTALEVAPLGRLAKPIYERVVQPGMRLFNSPLTRKWTTIGNHQYRLSSNSLGANGAHFTDNFGKEVTLTPYSGTDAQLIDAANEGQLRALQHEFSQDKIQQLKEAMKWDDDAIAEYQDEILRSFGTQADVRVKGVSDGYSNIGDHAGKIHQNREVSHSVTLNRDRIPNNETAIETGIHEMGAHGRTLQINPSEINVEGSYSNIVSKLFPRISEVMKKNRQIAEQTLILNEKGKLFQQMNSLEDLNKWLHMNSIPKEQWADYISDWKYFKYVVDEQEKMARGYTAQVYKTIDPNKETLNEQQLKKFFTPESVKQYSKNVLSFLPFLGLGTLYGKQE